MLAANSGALAAALLPLASGQCIYSKCIQAHGQAFYCCSKLNTLLKSIEDL